MDEKDISILCKNILLKYPFYGMFLVGLNKKINKDIPTAGVSLNGINFQLDVNPEFMMKMEPKEREAVLVHEILHLAFQHLWTRKDFDDWNVFNQAADVYINQLITDLPSFALTPEMYSLPKGESTQWYYNAIKKQAEDDPESFAGKMGQAMKDGKKVICSHKEWNDVTDGDEGQGELVQNQLDYQFKEVANQCSAAGINLPHELRSYLDGLFKINPPTFNWKKYVRQFVNGNIERYRKSTKKKPNKRFPDSRGHKFKYKPSAIVYLDGSGSVSEEEYGKFYSELQHLSKTINFDIAHFDYEVNKPYRYKGENKLPKSNGGTNFTHVREHFNKTGDEYSFAVIFTDGEAEPAGKFNKPTLWLITREYSFQRCKEDQHGVKVLMK